MHNPTLNRHIALKKFIDAFLTTVCITKQNLNACKKEEHKHVRPTAQERTRGATTTIVCQTHGFVPTVPASGVAVSPTASTVTVERNIYQCSAPTRGKSVGKNARTSHH